MHNGRRGRDGFIVYGRGGPECAQPCWLIQRRNSTFSSPRPWQVRRHKGSSVTISPPWVPFPRCFIKRAELNSHRFRRMEAVDSASGGHDSTASNGFRRLVRQPVSREAGQGAWRPPSFFNLRVGANCRSLRSSGLPLLSPPRRGAAAQAASVWPATLAQQSRALPRWRGLLLRRGLACALCPTLHPILLACACA